VKRKYILPLFLFIQILLVRILAGFPEVIEVGYSKGFYPKLAHWSRKILGEIPFSVGDVLYHSYSTDN